MVDVVAFNILLVACRRSTSWHPSFARVAAVARRDGGDLHRQPLADLADAQSAQARHREVALFVVFNLIGWPSRSSTLVLSHDVLGLTSRLADNISANVVGLALGTAVPVLVLPAVRVPVVTQPARPAPSVQVRVRSSSETRPS